MYFVYVLYVCMYVCIVFSFAAPMRSHIEKLNCIAARNITCVIGSRSADSYGRVWFTLGRILTATKGKSSAWAINSHA